MSIPDLSEIVYYDEQSPSCLTFLVDLVSGKGGIRKNCIAGGFATAKDTNGYWVVGFNSKAYLSHRIIWEMLIGELQPGDIIDHIDGDINNNLISNLRKVDRVINRRNSRKAKNNPSGVTGVHFYYDKRDGRTSCLCTWRDINQKPRTKSFSVSYYGLMPAFLMACEYRKSMISHLNKLGAGYTERHGN